MPKVYFPVYTSNTGALTALFGGQIDWTGNFIPGLQKNFVSPNPADHHYWEAPGGTNSLVPNLNKWPTNQLAVRQAISAAINRTLIADEGEAGLEDPVPTPPASRCRCTRPGPRRSPHDHLRHQRGRRRGRSCRRPATPGSNGFFDKDGKTVTLTITDPSAYTDYAEDDSIAAQELRAAGIDATFQGQSVDAWNSDVAGGDFQLTSHWSNGGAGITPYNKYDGWLDSSLATGNAATGDFERLNDPTVQAMLAKLAGADTTAAQTAALAPIAKYVAANLPIIPITTASEWFEYNSQNFVGWPTQSNPYETGQPSGHQQRPRLWYRRGRYPAPDAAVLAAAMSGPPRHHPPTGAGPSEKPLVSTPARLAFSTVAFSVHPGVRATPAAPGLPAGQGRPGRRRPGRARG